jgi:hypothetical protein
MDPNPSQFVQELAEGSSIRKGLFFGRRPSKPWGLNLSKNPWFLTNWEVRPNSRRDWKTSQTA